ncbi:MAG: hypothetical protein BYD32DRAFT_215270 [Podila humilis]|nr:MAG: hypothetical protein BYD32DRAFT_215270 [Podila humilis]
MCWRDEEQDGGKTVCIHASVFKTPVYPVPLTKCNIIKCKAFILCVCVCAFVVLYFLTDPFLAFALHWTHIKPLHLPPSSTFFFFSFLFSSLYLKTDFFFTRIPHCQSVHTHRHPFADTYTHTRTYTPHLSYFLLLLFATLLLHKSSEFEEPLSTTSHSQTTHLILTSAVSVSAHGCSRREEIETQISQRTKK